MVCLFPWKESPLSEGPLVAWMLRDSLHSAPRCASVSASLPSPCEAKLLQLCLPAPSELPKCNHVFMCVSSSSQRGFRKKRQRKKRKKSCFQVDSIRNLKLLHHCFGIKNKTKCTRWCRQALFLQASGLWSAAPPPPHCLLLHPQPRWPPLFWPRYSQCSFKSRTLCMIFSLLFLSLFA